MTTKTHCEQCGTRLKLLYSSWYCPKGCDKKWKAEPEETTDFEIDIEWDQDKTTKPMGVPPCLHIWVGIVSNYKYQFKYQCRVCGGVTDDLSTVHYPP